MAKNEEDKSKTRTVCLTDKQLRKVKKITKEESLTKAVRKLIQILENK